MNALLSIISGVFASLAFATAIGYTRLYLYLTNRQLLCIAPDNAKIQIS